MVDHESTENDHTSTNTASVVECAVNTPAAGAVEEEEEPKPGLDFRGLGPVYQSVFLDVMGIRYHRPAPFLVTC
jgi:hypothetical protein